MYDRHWLLTQWHSLPFTMEKPTHEPMEWTFEPNEHAVGWPEAQNILRTILKGPRAMRPTPGQCVECSQTDARTKLWVRRTNRWQTCADAPRCNTIIHDTPPQSDSRELKWLLYSLFLDLLHCPYPIASQGFKRNPGKQAQLGPTAINQFPSVLGTQ